MWETKGNDYVELVYKNPKIEKLLSELRKRSPYAQNGRVDYSYLILKIKLDEEIITLEEKLKEKKEED